MEGARTSDTPPGLSTFPLTAAQCAFGGAVVDGEALVGAVEAGASADVVDVVDGSFRVVEARAGADVERPPDAQAERTTAAATQ